MKNLSRVSTLKLTIAFLICAVLQTSADAAGVVDRAFGTNGTVTTAIPINPSNGDVVFLPDGKFIVIGASLNSIRLIRFNENGSLDTSFGDNGTVVFPFFGVAINAAELQSDGKIVVVGSASVNGSVDFFIARFNSNGSIDSTFGSGGVATVNQGSFDFFTSLAIQPDGKIVAAGNTSDGGRRGAVIRFNSNGTIDMTFANEGLFYYSFPTTPITRYAGFYDIKVLPNGRILTAATFSRSFPNEAFSGYFLLMLDADGSIYPDFGSQGIASGGRNGNSGSDERINFEILPNGRIFVAFIGGIRVLNQNGSLYKQLPFEGIKTTIFPDGRVLVYGESSFFFSRVGHIKLYSGENFIGKAKNVLNGVAYAQPNGKILIAGLDSTSNRLVLSRLNLITSQGTRIADYNRDDKTDFGVFKPSNGTLSYRFLTSDGEQFNMSLLATEIIPEFSEYTDANGFIRRDSIVHWRRGTLGVSGSAYEELTRARDVIFNQPWGFADDIPTGGDFNGDALTDLTVFRPSNGVWYSIRGENNQVSAVQWGTNGDKPVPADYDYDGKTDYAVYRPSTGTWWIRRSSDGTSFGVRFGNASDIPLTGDYDGDGRADFVVFRPSDGVWYQLLTTDGFRAIQFGFGTDIPVPGDFDGDGRHDIAVFRQGIWYLLQSTEGFKAVRWGMSGDAPVSVRYDE